MTCGSLHCMLQVLKASSVESYYEFLWGTSTVVLFVCVGGTIGCNSSRWATKYYVQLVATGGCPYSTHQPCLEYCKPSTFFRFVSMSGHGIFIHDLPDLSGNLLPPMSCHVPHWFLDWWEAVMEYIPWTAQSKGFNEMYVSSFDWMISSSSVLFLLFVCPSFKV